MQEQLKQHGQGWPHLSFICDDVKGTFDQRSDWIMKPKNESPHDGVLGYEAGIVHPQITRDVVWEMTGSQ